MNAEIISIGTEILKGEITDTNATYLASQLPLLGIDLHWVSQVGDNQARLVDTFSRAHQRADVVVATGGLGPTTDDLTREAIAEVMGEELQVDQGLEQNLRALFSLMGREMPSHNIKQATLISSAQSIPNPRGSAPGWWVEKDGKIIAAMPGPPGEMRYMWENEVFPRLQPRCGGGVILLRTLKTLGETEAGLDELVSPLIHSTPAEIGIYAKPDGIHVRIIAKSPVREEAENSIQQTEASLREILGHYVWGVDDDTLVDVVGKLLIDRRLTLATMESYTGGYLASALTEAPQSTAFYKGGFVLHSEGTELATGLDPQLIGQYGAISAEAANAMASTARERLGADIGMGIAGTTSAHRLGNIVFVTVDDGYNKRAHQATYPIYRPEWKTWATLAALFELRSLLSR